MRSYTRSLLHIAIALCVILPQYTLAADNEPRSTYMRGRITSGSQIDETNFDGEVYKKFLWNVHITSGQSAGQSVTVEHGVLGTNSKAQYSIGDTLVLEEMQKADQSKTFLIRDTYRLPWLLALGMVFFLIAFAIGGFTSMRALLGLCLSIAIILFYIIPQIIQGSNPLITALVAAIFITCTSLVIAHGFNRRTWLACLSTGLTLLITISVSTIFVKLASLRGMGSEESLFLQFSNLGSINLQGLLLGGIIIGALGILDDVTTAQIATIDEISKANHSLSAADLYQAAMSVGKEHVASLINTLALAYAGAALPMLLLFYTNTDTPIWVTMNSEFLAEEIVRTLVGSISLLLAVPISSVLAARTFAFGNHTDVHTPCCTHHGHI